MHIVSGDKDSVCETETERTVEYTDVELDDLVLSAKHGNNEAYTELIRRYTPLIYSVIQKRISCFHEVQDVFQDVCLQGFLKLHQLNNPAAFASWIARMASRKAINVLTRTHHPFYLHEEIEIAVPEESSVQLIQSEQRECMLQVMCTLKELDQQALRDFYFDGLSLIEIATLREAPIGTIKRRLHYARKRLAHALREVTDISEFEL